MVVKILKSFNDRLTGEIRIIGSFIEVDDERGSELVEKGFATEYIPAPRKKSRGSSAKSNKAAEILDSDIIRNTNGDW